MARSRKSGVLGFDSSDGAGVRDFQLFDLGQLPEQLAIVSPIAAESSERNHSPGLSRTISKNSRRGASARMPA